MSREEVANGKTHEQSRFPIMSVLDSRVHRNQCCSIVMPVGNTHKSSCRRVFPQSIEFADTADSKHCGNQTSPLTSPRCFKSHNTVFNNNTITFNQLATFKRKGGRKSITFLAINSHRVPGAPRKSSVVICTCHWHNSRVLNILCSGR